MEKTGEAFGLSVLATDFLLKSLGSFQTFEWKTSVETGNSRGIH